MTTGEILNQAKSLFDDPENVKIINQFLAFLQSNEFRLCIAGGFSRGKSRFINMLLEKAILPESAVPTTAYTTEIRYGKEEKLEVIYSDGNMESKTLSRENLDAFSLYNTSDMAIMLRVYLPLPILKGGLVIIDTPGVEDALEAGDSTILSAINNAEAAIIMISAIAPFSLTERAFINEYLISRKLPLIAAAISFIDQLPVADRKKQIKFTIKRCHDYFPDMKILAADCAELKEPDLICGVDNIHKLLLKWQNLANLSSLKTGAILSRLKEMAESHLTSISARKELLSANLADANKNLTDAVIQLEDGCDVAIELRLKFIEKAERVKDLARKEINSFFESIVDNRDKLTEEKIMDTIFNLNELITKQAKSSLQKATDELMIELEQRFCVPANFMPMHEVGFAPLVLTKISLNHKPQNSWVEVIMQKGLALGDIYASRIPAGSLVWQICKPNISLLLSKSKSFLSQDANAKAAYRKEIKNIQTRMGRLITDGIQQVYQNVFSAIKDSRLKWLKNRRDELPENITLEQIRQKIAKLDNKLAETKILLTEINKQMESIYGQHG